MLILGFASATSRILMLGLERGRSLLQPPRCSPLIHSAPHFLLAAPLPSQGAWRRQPYDEIEVEEIESFVVAEDCGEERDSAALPTKLLTGLTPESAAVAGGWPEAGEHGCGRREAVASLRPGTRLAFSINPSFPQLPSWLLFAGMQDLAAEPAAMS